MYILLSIIIALVGLIMIINPGFIFEVTESWKSYSASEPSDLYILSTRLGGIFFLLAGIAGVIILLFL